MSGMAPFSGMSAGSGSGPGNPMAGQLRRIGSFRQALANRQNQVNDYMAVADHAHANNKDLITHASREERRNQTHGAKVKAGLVEGLRNSGVDAAAPGRTRIKFEGLEVDTVRPEPKAQKKTGAKKPNSSKTSPAPTSSLPPIKGGGELGERLRRATPNHDPLQPKFQSP